MSRAIKFRVWVPDESRSAYMYPDENGRPGTLRWGNKPPEYAIKCGHPVPIVHGPGCGSSQKIGEMTLDGKTILIAGDIHPKAVLEQFTGLLDSEGVEIYEGDIVEIRAYDGWKDTTGFLVNYEIKWSSIAAGWRGFRPGLDSAIHSGVALVTIGSTIDTVLGNIHEHPHLLK